MRKIVVPGRDGVVRRHRTSGMKRTTTALVALGLVVSQGYAADGRSKTKKPPVKLRKVDVPYEVERPSVQGILGLADTQGIPVAVGPHERFMSFHIVDWSGRPVHVTLTAQDDGGMTGLQFCGTTNGLPIPVPSGKTIYFWLRSGLCDSEAVAVATQGNIEVTFGDRWFAAEHYKEWAES